MTRAASRLAGVLLVGWTVLVFAFILVLSIPPNEHLEEILPSSS